jgi:phosphotransferase system HPr-like phosphotransfer protein
MGLLTLALEQGHTVELITDGPDAEPVAEALGQFLQRDEEPEPPKAVRGGARG